MTDTDTPSDTLAFDPTALFPNCVDTGHTNKKGEKIYRSTRVKKNGTEKVSFFTINTKPTKRHVSKQWLVKNNMSFLPLIKRDDPAVHAADSRRDR
jgi:hypothetical protein